MNKQFKPSGKNTNCLEYWCCPMCGNEDKFNIVLTTKVTLEDDGTDFYDCPDCGQVDYDGDSPAMCPECGYADTVSAFDTQYMEEEDSEQVFNYHREEFNKVMNSGSKQYINFKISGDGSATKWMAVTHESVYEFLQFFEKVNSGNKLKIITVKHCEQCPYINTGGSRCSCGLNSRVLPDVNSIPPWCPL